jgi:serine/threonine-protein kinase
VTDSSTSGGGKHATDADLRAPGASEEAKKKAAQKNKHVLAGKYLLEREIARGAMGRVFLATQISLKRRVAVKVMAPRYGGPDFDKRFLLEARSAAALSHRNIVTVHDYGRTKNNLLFMAMEFLDGPTLSQLVTDEGKLPWARACNIAQQIARGLRSAHGMGLIHRDLKPGNVILLDDPDEGDFAKVLDFGLAKVQPAADISVNDGEGPITNDGLMIGTPGFMAPEQIRLETVDQRADIYALGAILFFLLTGKKPFEAPSDVEALHAQLTGQVPYVTQMPGCEELPEELDSIVATCLAREPSQRFQHAGDLIDELRILLQNIAQEFVPEKTGLFDVPAPIGPEPTIEAPDAEPVTAPAAASSRLNLISVAIIVLALAGGAFGWQALDKPSPPPEVVKKEPKKRPTKVAVLTDPEGIEVVSASGMVLGETPLVLPIDGTTVVKFRYKGVESEATSLRRAELEHSADLKKWVKKVKWDLAEARAKKKKAAAKKKGARQKGAKKAAPEDGAAPDEAEAAPAETPPAPAEEPAPAASEEATDEP